MSNSKLAIGDQAPDFVLIDQNKKTVRLSEFQGTHNVVLSWHIHSFTSG